MNVGQHVMLNCRVIAGTPVPNLQWIRRDLKPLSHRIEQQQPGSIVIKDITVEEAGEYECLASNIVGKVSQAISIIVQQPQPIITIWPKQQEIYVTIGTKLALYCNVNATTLNLKWFGPNSVNARIEYLPNGIWYYKDNTSRQDEGTYICRDSSKNAIQNKRIKVLIQPKFDSLTSTFQTVSDGDT